MPVGRQPIVFPRTAGMRWEPALVFEAPSVTWKYRGLRTSPRVRLQFGDLQLNMMSPHLVVSGVEVEVWAL